ncbi:MAG TPA: mucoidy inhibitor MuiA family protein [Cyclobacteriaceae bacterium]|nr:mucoidy inhibitor MuiA family protein [Cyclobacteriaceae bacterium]HMV08323.1 mucoidy inhibitor MuiA family protein [Cyclobacteriaceae bacterium]HMV88400.1 mucoidy inhibitor MuiA family protein [Cyclobacteriaceae bacterium]HMX02166.1 mucoidy inhibitor MuiA family protein [Cyclobacteriaceae bacterium]HMX49858.1 mucoidy inhibitor MuiA family protein [Cyclobacteriaceae bacterium]
MRFLLTTALVLGTLLSYSQNFKEKELKTEIKEVTVFLKGAQIFETGSVVIPQGNTILKVKGLSSFVDEKSVQVKATGDFTILSVNHSLNHVNELKKNEKADSLTKVMEAIDLSIDYENARADVLKEKKSILDENRNLGGQNSGASITQLKQAMDFYEIEVAKIKSEQIKIRRTLEAKNGELVALQQQLKEVNDRPVWPSGEIEIRVAAEAQTNAKFTITYMVGNAGWYPKYDVRVKDIKSPLQLIYKAELFQNTGIDWKNVKLRFSNGSPNQSGMVPTLLPWNLTYARYTHLQPNIYYGLDAVRSVQGRVTAAEDGSALPGASVIVKGTTIGTVTDGGGNYALTLPNGASALTISYIGYRTEDVTINQSKINVAMEADQAQLSEAVVTAGGLSGRANGITLRGYSNRRSLAYKASAVKAEDAQSLATNVIENQTTVEIEVATPYTVKSNGEKLMIDLKKYDIDALYEYYAIPKLDKDAFLMARIINWDQYSLLEGEANLYFEDAFVGRSILDAKSLQDTLSISLGRDRSIVISREKNEQFSKRKVLSGNIQETKGFKIVVRNKKSQAINLTLFDQVPVSIIDDITVTLVELSKAKFDKKTGQVAWDLNIDPQQQKEINLQYEVKYPKNESVLLE